ncbi:uncharacterized protein V1510DRAFT_390028 [Dipodascopsis tothii]|uniref:uncharacterized protein n=1 Tax=Dipodascopsis tothii TaxID=44089 RepID=UPI0034CEEF9A
MITAVRGLRWTAVRRAAGVRAAAGPRLAVSAGTLSHGQRRQHSVRSSPADVEAMVHAEEQQDLVTLLRQRGLVANVTSDEFENAMRRGQPLAGYCGADPTAQSLHVGNLLPLLVLVHFGIRGHKMIGLVGGATVELGDPSGRTSERTALSEVKRTTNQDLIATQLQRMLRNGLAVGQAKGYSRQGELIACNNADWWRGVTMLEFMARIGRHVRVGQMLARESVKARLGSAEGIGFHEFSYQILQAYDFWHLHNAEGCDFQVGGSDQWGNITAGLDLITRLAREEERPPRPVFGLTVPLLTTAAGEKFGKSAGNAVWLDAAMTSPFKLYQFFLRSADADVGRYLRMLTLLPLAEIERVLAAHAAAPERRAAQQVLAEEMTALIHGGEALKRAQTITNILFAARGQQIEHSAADILAAFANDPDVIAVDRATIADMTLTRALAHAGVGSNKRLTQLVRSGGVYVLEGSDLVRVDDPTRAVADLALLDGRLLVVRLGKAEHVILRVD